MPARRPQRWRILPGVVALATALLTLTQHALAAPAADPLPTGPAPLPPKLTAPAELVIRPGAVAAVQAVFARPPAEPRLAVSEGDLRQVTAQGVMLRGLYHPPAWGPPRVAVLVAWDAADQELPPAAVRIRLSGAVEVPVSGQPGALVMVELAGQRFGPEWIGPDGQGLVQARTAPGLAELQARVLDRAGRLLAAVPFAWPTETQKQTAIVVDPLELTADGQALGRIFVATFQPDGQLLDDRPPRLQLGRPLALGELARVAAGLYSAIYRAPLLVAESELTLDARLAEEPPSQAKVELAPAPLANLVITALPDTLSPGGGAAAESSTVVLQVLTGQGRGVPGLPLTMEASLGGLSAVEDLGDGTYSATYSLPELPPPLPAEVVVTARLPGAAAGDPLRVVECSLILEPGPPHILRISTHHDRVPADGRTGMPLQLELTDAQGNRATGQPVLRVDQGELGPLVVTGPSRFEIAYLPPARPELAVQHELQFSARWEGRPLSIVGGLTLAPVIEPVPPAPPGALPPGWGWLTGEGPAPDEAAELLLGMRVGWLALVGDGLFGKAGGPSVEVELLRRVSASSPLYLGAVSGLARSSYSARVTSPHFSPSLGVIDLQVSQSHVPLMGATRLRWPVLARPNLSLSLSLGVHLGGLVVLSDVAGDGLAVDLGGSAFCPAAEVPLGLDLQLGRWSLVAEAALLRTLTDLPGSEQSGTVQGLQGPVTGLAARAGARWRLP